MSIQSSRFRSINISTIDRSSRKQLSKLNPVGFSLSDATLPSSSKRQGNKKSEASCENDKIMRLKIKKAWDLALSPAKSIPMNAFMLYMSGNSIQIFSIMITAMLFWNSLSAISSSSQAFEQFQTNPGDADSKGAYAGIKRLFDSNLIYPLLIFVLIQSANFALGIWKCSSMGLLPTTTSDWLAFMKPSIYQETVHHYNYWD